MIFVFNYLFKIKIFYIINWKINLFVMKYIIFLILSNLHNFQLSQSILVKHFYLPKSTLLYNSKDSSIYYKYSILSILQD
jgi:hypothetical protein